MTIKNRMHTGEPLHNALQVACARMDMLLADQGGG